MIKWIVFAVSLFGLAASLLVGRRHKFRRHFFWRRVIVVWLALVATIIIALLPLGVKTNTNSASNLDVIFVADITPSANAVDGRGGNETTRLQNMREDMHTIAKQNTGASVSIITFSDQINNYLPLTTNSNDINNAIDTIYTATEFQTVQKIVPYKQVFEHVSDYVAGQQRVDPTRERVVVFMSDFEIYKDQDQIDQVTKTASGISSHGAGYVGLLYGQESGGKILNMAFDYENSQPVPSYTLYGNEEYTKYLQNNYKTVTSVPNGELAASISKQMGTDLVRTAQSQEFQPVMQKAAGRSARSAAASPQTQALHQNVLYIVPAGVLFAWLCLAELIKPRWLKLNRQTKDGATPGESQV